MRIGIRVSPRSSGGGRVFVDNLVESLEATGACDSVVVLSMGSGSTFSAANQVTVPVPRTAAGRQLLGDGALSRVLQEDPVDVLICPGNEVARVEGIPSVMWPLTVAPFEDAAMRQLGHSPQAAARWRLLRASVGRAARRADASVFSSHYTRSLYFEQYPKMAARPSAVLPPAPSLHEDGGAGEDVSLPSRYILFVSHMYPYKMVDELIQGFGKACDLGVQHDLVIAGRGTHPDYEARVRRRVAALGLESRVHFMGSVDAPRLPQLYKQADLFVFPSISENAGSYALLDAFVFGVPVLSSSTSSMPEACQQAARYFDPRDPEQLGSEMAHVLLDGSALKLLAEASRLRAGELPRWHETAGGLVEFCDRLLVGGSRG